MFEADFPETNAFPLLRTTVQTFTASVLMGAVTYGALNILVLVFNQDRFWGVFFQGLVAAFFGCTIFVTVLLMLRNQEMLEFIASLRKRFWKADVVVEQGDIDIY